MISGRVQCVGFRYFALDKAEALHIAGWVQNTPDGKVEIEASGEGKNLDTFVDWMKMGPARAVIQKFTLSDISPQRNFTHFIIR